MPKSALSILFVSRWSHYSLTFQRSDPTNNKHNNDNKKTTNESKSTIKGKRIKLISSANWSAKNKEMIKQELSRANIDTTAQFIWWRLLSDVCLTEEVRFAVQC